MSNEFSSISSSFANKGKGRDYGKWTKNREIAAIEAAIEFHPFELESDEKETALENVCNEVNDTDPEYKKLGKLAIDRKIKSLIKATKEKTMSGITYGTGSNDSETRIEHLVCSLISLMERHEESKAEDNEDAIRALAQKLYEEDYIIMSSKRGMERRKSPSVSQVDNSQMLLGSSAAIADIISEFEDEDEVLDGPHLKRVYANEKMAQKMKAVKAIEAASVSIAKFAEKQEEHLQEQKRTNQDLQAALDRLHVMQNDTRRLMDNDMQRLMHNQNVLLERLSNQFPAMPPQYPPSFPDNTSRH
ncbi:hypothetical protein CLU79DRAFT_889526 [Phycomyces nitens]|nr:hypothetical protein CLU79DRAFT_889526 [Phycomyces nitens]